jgi:sulfide:quinone oxidoreductase
VRTDGVGVDVVKNVSMKRFGGSESCRHVVIAGGGFAGVEALLALWELGSERVRVTLVAPEPRLFYQPAATAEVFEDDPPRCYDLEEITSELGAVFVKARVVSVGSQTGYVRLSSGPRLTYDDLVLATGGRATAGVAGAVMFRGQRDVPALRLLVREIDREAVRRVGFALPAGTSWPLPLYELALLFSSHAAEHDLRTEITLVTPERAPLDVFGSEASRLVASLLVEQGITFVPHAIPDHVSDNGSLALRSGTTVGVDRVVAVPQLRGRSISGVPTDHAGFVPIDSTGRVQDLPNVYAAGDMTTFPVKQGGLAAQQADGIAEAILATAGVAVVPGRVPRILQARLIGGADPLFLRAELDECGRATSAAFSGSAPSESPIGNKVLARYLTPYLDKIGPAAPVES